MEPIVLGIGFTALMVVCAVSAISSWQTRRLMIAVFGANPRAAQLGQRGYYTRPPNWPPDAGPSTTPAAPPAPGAPAAPPSAPAGSSGARPVAAAEPVAGSSSARVLPPTDEPAPGPAAPGTSDARALPPADEPMPGSSGPPKRYIIDGRIAAGTHGPPAAPLDGGNLTREPFRPPSLTPMPDYAADARRPAPDADDVDSTPGDKGAPDTTRKPGSAPRSRERPAVTPQPDLAALRRDLDAADRAQADLEPQPRVPTTRPQPTSQQAPPASRTHASIAPPGSAPALPPGPGIVAAGLGERPIDPRTQRGREPAPHAPPKPVRRPTLLGITPPGSAPPPPVSVRPLPAVAPPPPRSPAPSQPASVAEASPAVALPSASGDFDDEDEVTRMGPRPSPAELAVAGAPASVAEGAPAPAPAPARRIHATLASMPSVRPRARAAPEVNVVVAPSGDDDDQRPTQEPAATTAPVMGRSVGAQ